MANYITRPAIDRRAGKTDIEQLMPYLQNELATVRTNDNAKIATLQKMEANALANPDAYRGTKFHISNDGFVNMNEKAKGLMRPKDGFDYSQDAINESSDVINRELTNQLTTDAVDKIANTEERRTAAAQAKEIGNLDTNRLAQLALDGKDSQGQDLIDKGIATTTPPTTQQTEGAIATSQSNPNSTGPTLTAEQIAANDAEQSDPNFTGPTLTAEQIAANNPTKSNSDVLKTGTAAEKANELAKQNPGMGAKATDRNAASRGSGMGRNWTVTTDIGVGKSNIKTDAVHDIKTTQRAGIIDQDAVDLKSLKVAAGLEDILNSAKAGRPGSVPMTAMANRLAQREAFLTDIQNKRGVVTSTKQTGGNVDAGLGEMNAKFTSKTGVDSYTNISNSTSSTGAVQVDRGGDGSTKDGTQGTFDVGTGSTNKQRIAIDGTANGTNKAGEPAFSFTSPEAITEEAGSLISNIKNGNLPGWTRSKKSDGSYVINSPQGGTLTAKWDNNKKGYIISATKMSSSEYSQVSNFSTANAKIGTRQTTKTLAPGVN